MAKTIQQLEKEFFQTAAGAGGYLSDLQRKVIARDTTLDTNDIKAFLRQFITDNGGSVENVRYESELWKRAVSATGQTPTNYINQNKRLFYQSPVAQLYYYIKSLSGLVAYYPLNETEGNAINRAPATFGTLNGTVTGATQGVNGLLGKAYSFNGTSDLVTVSDHASLRGMVSVSWVFMLNLPTTSVYRKIIKSDNFDIGIENNGRVFSELVGVTNGNINIWDNQPVDGVDDSTWRMFVLTYDGTNIKIGRAHV